MIEYLQEIITIGKYIVYISAILGVFLIILGLVKDKRELITRGAYLIILAIVLGICGYLIYNKTEDRANQIIYDYLDNTNSDSLYK